MDKSVILSGLFIGKCILFSSCMRVYYLNFDKDRNPNLFLNMANTAYFIILFYQLVDMSAHMHKMLE
jgi:hypothetical protein